MPFPDGREAIGLMTDSKPGGRTAAAAGDGVSRSESRPYGAPAMDGNAGADSVEARLRAGRERPIIAVRGLGKSFSVNGALLPIFRDLSLDVPRGGFVSLIGPSGCGKSTLLKLVCGLETPTEGTVVFNERTVQGPARGMIYVFQQYSKSIFPWRTALQNVEFGLIATGKSRGPGGRARCREYMRLVGLEGYENHYPYQLSGGMQQRVAIARALICEPEVLLMDEPFSAVDAMTRAILQELILQIWEELKLTVLFVTHDVEEAIFLSSNVISLGRAPSGIHDQRVVGLPYPRDQIRTREEPEFVNLRHRLLSTILAEEKSVTAPADAAGLR